MPRGTLTSRDLLISPPLTPALPHSLPHPPRRSDPQRLRRPHRPRPDPNPQRRSPSSLPRLSPPDLLLPPRPLHHPPRLVPLPPYPRHHPPRLFRCPPYCSFAAATTGAGNGRRALRYGSGSGEHEGDVPGAVAGLEWVYRRVEQQGTLYAELL